MNLILLFDNDFIADNRVRLTDRRLQHAQDVLRVKEGDVLTVGKLNGLMGEGKVVGISETALELEVNLHQPPPLALPLTLIMPLARPPVLKRIFLCAASLGVKHIIVCNFNRVEKSLWNSSALRPEFIQEQLVLGLEQGKDTVMPQVLLRERFKPFVEDELPQLMEGSLGLVAHPGTSESCPRAGGKPVTLIIGPEGGLVDFEVAKLMGIGFQAIDLGPRILRVEAVLPLLVGKIF